VRPVAARAAGGSSSSTSATGSGSGALGNSFNSTLTGTVSQSQEPGGAIVELNVRVNGAVHGRMRVRIAGVPIGGGSGGLSMTGSQVDLAVAGQPSVLQGHIASLQGTVFNARLSDGRTTNVDVHVELQINSQDDTVTGTLSGSPAGA
jgi:hypothetical protein